MPTRRAPTDEQQAAAPLVPPHPTIPSLRHAAATCQACDLWRIGTQTVFGDGPARARVVMVGEQPGNDEDLEGEPFVGPAGRVLDRALEEAGIDRRDIYLTNIVKHFKWVAKGKKRIHQKPNAREVRACKAWLDAEIGAVRPDVVVLLGATAAQGVLGRQFRVTVERGRIIGNGPGGLTYFATVHPSSVLRAPDDDTRRLEMARFVDDLRLLARYLATAKLGA
jgi:DNA polymerase